MKDKADRFDTMFEEEATKIRLDESGWKQRWVGLHQGGLKLCAAGMALQGNRHSLAVVTLWF